MSSISEHLDPKQNSLWWLRNAVKTASLKQKDSNVGNEIISPNKLEINISSSVEDLFENEDDYSGSFEDASETDIGSIIDEINKIASQSPIGNYGTASDKSVEEILKEAEKLYMESSKSFEQLSSKSKTPIDFSIPKSKSSISFKSSSLNTNKPTPSPSYPVLDKLNLPSDNKHVKSIDSDRTEIQSPEDEEVDLMWEKENEDVNNLVKVPSDHSLDFKEFEDKMSEVDRMKESIDDILRENINELKENLQEFSKEEKHSFDNNIDNKILEEMLHEDDTDLQDEAINELNKEIENLKKFTNI